MNIYEICVVIITIVLLFLGVYSFLLIRSVQKTMAKLNNTLDGTTTILQNADTTISNANKSTEVFNQHLPNIMADLESTAANLRTISQDTVNGVEHIENNALPVLSRASNMGNYIVKGYNIWKRIKKNRV